MKPQSLSSWFKYAAYVILAVALLSSLRNLANPFLTYDEAGQYYISKGLNHDSKPYAASEAVDEVSYNNARYNLDPGGFSVILHYWSAISTNIVWLRLLPFMFFLGFLMLSWKVLKSVTGNIQVSILILCLFILPFNFFSQAFVLRAYSMELMCMALCLLSLIELGIDSSNQRFLLFGSGLAFLSTSRYLAIVLVIVCSIILAYKIFKEQKEQGRLSELIRKVLTFVLPIFIIHCLTLFFSLRIQIGQLTSLHYLEYIRDNPKIIFRYPGYLLILLVMFVLYLLYHRLLNAQMKQLMLYVLVINMLIVILSFFGQYPWNPFDKRGMTLTYATTLIGAATMFVLLRKYVKSHEQALSIMVILCMVIMIHVRRQNFFLVYKSDVMIQKIASLNINSDNRVYVDFYAAPVVRFAYEMGYLTPLANRHQYPDNFYFEKYGTHDFTSDKNPIQFYIDKPNMDEISGYSYIVAPVLQYNGPHILWKNLHGSEVIFARRDK